MISCFARFPITSHLCAILVSAALTLSGPAAAETQATAFKQAVAETAAQDQDIAAFYRSNGYQGIWTGNGADANRRAALIKALGTASDHGLPPQRYDVDGLKAQMAAARTQRDLGRLEVDLSRAFLQFARDLQTGVLIPSRIDPLIVRDVPYRDRTSYLVNFAKTSPTGFFRSLAPNTTEYTALMKEKLLMERQLAQGGWGPTVPGKSLKPGASGQGVIALRDRLVAMGYLDRTARPTYDAKMTQAVKAFQAAHGLEPDGVAGEGTLTEINVSLEKRLQSVIVAMERERWLNRDRGDRHILVNLTDFTAKIIDHGKVTFETRSVIGAKKSDRQSPEFSDVMEHMVINPSWHVPRSIITKEYLPALRANPAAVSHMVITDRWGRVVDRATADFSQYTSGYFPYDLRQPPSRRNALGLVKFMFPNKYNIYLHDTPAKKLFARESRAYSHGCIRLADPFDFAHALLAAQSDDPEGDFEAVLKTRREKQVDLVDPVPVHLIYRTAFTTPKGHTQFRRDVYGRDAKIWQALSDAGVALRSVRG